MGNQKLFLPLICEYVWAFSMENKGPTSASYNWPNEKTNHTCFSSYFVSQTLSIQTKVVFSGVSPKTSFWIWSDIRKIKNGTRTILRFIIFQFRKYFAISRDSGPKSRILFPECPPPPKWLLPRMYSRINLSLNAFSPNLLKNWNETKVGFVKETC